MSKEFKPGSIEHRKKVAEKYHMNTQEIIDMPEDKFQVFCTGLEIGEKYGGLRATYGILKNPDPKQVIDMIYALDDEGRNMVLDEFCEPEPATDAENTCFNCLYKDVADDKEPCHTCNDCSKPYELWTSAKPQKYCENCEHRNLSDNLEPCRDCVDYSEWEAIGNEEASENTKAE